MTATEMQQYTPLRQGDEEGVGDDNNVQLPPTVQYTKKRSSMIFILFKSLALIGLGFGWALWLTESCPTCHHDSCSLPSDKLFGEIPWVNSVLSQDDRYVETEPFESYVDGKLNPLWEDIYPGTWVAIDHPLDGDAAGQGMSMVHEGEDPVAWSPSSEGFGVGVMHQIHCVMVVKQSLSTLRRDHTEDDLPPDEHLHHCMEVLRLAIMCHGDMSLQKPEQFANTQIITGLDNTHLCRDWSSLHRAFMEKKIERADSGKWVDASVHDEPSDEP